ncbi:MAG: Uncharacterised protein [Cellulomonadaceae bacterium TMED98]|nr:MAG: Uncharacterised protein [Cellulomonadaceae bacterium TMED98]
MHAAVHHQVTHANTGSPDHVWHGHHVQIVVASKALFQLVLNRGVLGSTQRLGNLHCGKAPAIVVEYQRSRLFQGVARTATAWLSHDVVSHCQRGRVDVTGEDCLHNRHFRLHRRAFIRQSELQLGIPADNSSRLQQLRRQRVRSTQTSTHPNAKLLNSCQEIRWS